MVRVNDIINDYKFEIEARRVNTHFMVQCGFKVRLLTAQSRSKWIFQIILSISAIEHSEKLGCVCGRRTRSCHVSTSPAVNRTRISGPLAWARERPPGGPRGEYSGA